MVFDQLDKNRSLDFIPQASAPKVESLQINDTTYLDFLRIFNGGYFFDNALHIFGVAKETPYHDLNYINNLFQILFGDLAKDIWFFAEDIFGNPYGFHNDEIILFNLETSDKEVIANDFSGWLNEIDSDLDYYTGQSLAKELSKEDKFQLAYGKRLGAKYPFVMGGEYAIENLTLKDFENNIDYNSSIAKQIVNLPDGSSIKLDIIK